jgi:hypothetical protein
MRRAIAILVAFIAGGATTTILGWAGLADLAPRRGEVSRLTTESSWLHLEITTWHPGTTDHPDTTDQVDCETHHAQQE